MLRSQPLSFKPVPAPTKVVSRRIRAPARVHRVFTRCAVDKNSSASDERPLPDEASIVIIGSGVAGSSTAYQLVCEKGWKDVVVVDQGPLFKTGGSTSHAPGLVFQTNGNKLMCELAQETVDIFSSVDAFNPVGSLEVARTEERMAELHRRLGIGRSYGIEGGSILTPQEVKEHWPMVDDSTILGALHVPSDGLALAVKACEQMAKAIEEEAGETFYGDAQVLDIEIEDGKVVAVVTSRGRIATPRALVCTGIWGPLLARIAGFDVPLSPVEHQYATTDPVEEFAGAETAASAPMLRDQDNRMYFKQHWDSIGIGSYNHEPLLLAPERIESPAEAPVMPSVRPFTAEHWEEPWEQATELLPVLAGDSGSGSTGFQEQFNGLMSFTTDGNPVLGPVPGVEGFWVAVALWVTHSAGAGRVMADWLTDGQPRIDVHEADVSRFHPHELTHEFVHTRAAQQYREVYDILHPLQQMDAPRPIRTSPFYEATTALGAQHFHSAGWETPRWFACNEEREAARGVFPRDSWAGMNWSPAAAAEHVACRETAALFDLTPLCKLVVEGPGTLAYMQELCSAQMDVKVGRVVYTLMLNEAGGVLADLTVTRLGEEKYMVMTGGGVAPVHEAHMRRVLARHSGPSLENATAQMCSLGLFGPNAQAILDAASEADVSAEAIPYFRSATVDIAGVPTLALRISYAGESGWELHAPAEGGGALWGHLMATAADVGLDLAPAGGAAFDTLRLEKGYRLWGADVDADRNPYEAGLGFAVATGTKKNGDLRKQEAFIGRAACEAAADVVPAEQLCCLTLIDPNPVVLGTEPIVDLKTKEVVGFVASAGYGYTIGHCIVYAYLPARCTQPGTVLGIEYFDKVYRAKVCQEPLYDPKGAKVRTAGKKAAAAPAPAPPAVALEEVRLDASTQKKMEELKSALDRSPGGGKQVVRAGFSDYGRTAGSPFAAGHANRLKLDSGDREVNLNALLSEQTYAWTRLPLNEALTLNPEAYTSQTFFEFEQQALFFKTWQVVAYVDQLREAGDTMAVKVQNQSIILTRTHAGELKAYYNTCRHRGSEMVKEDGKFDMISCPYHRWGYTLDGELRGTPMFRGDLGTSLNTRTNAGCLPERPAGFQEVQNKCFDKADYGLLEVRVEAWDAFVLVNLSGDAPPLQEFAGDLYNRFDEYDLAEWRVYADKEYEVQSNWKVTAENYMEYYHLPAVHPELCNVSGVSEHMREQGPGCYMGFKTSPLTNGGTPVDPDALPIHPNISPTNAVTAYHTHLFPNVSYSVYPHSMFVVHMMPTAAGTTLERTTLLVHPDLAARKEEPELAEALKEEWAFWDQINKEDIWACEGVQRGVQSVAYGGGRLVAKYEETIHRFQNMVIDHLIGEPRIPDGDESLDEATRDFLN